MLKKPSHNALHERLVRDEAAKVFRKMAHQSFIFRLMAAGNVRGDETAGFESQRVIVSKFLAFFALDAAILDQMIGYPPFPLPHKSIQ